MSKYYYHKKNRKFKRRLVRLGALLIFLAGFSVLLYVFLPLLSWQIYFAPVFASQNIAIPIPRTTVVAESSIGSLFSAAGRSLNVDYTNADNWYPMVKKQSVKNATYMLTIPKLGIKNAIVSTADNDLSSHLVHFNATSLPPQSGNSVIFGHSTLPQLFDVKNYKTIFTYAYKLSQGDEIFVTINSVQYLYKVQNSIVVEADDTSILAQNYDGSYLTLVTCTPPGTVWKRLAIKTKLQKI